MTLKKKFYIFVLSVFLLGTAYFFIGFNNKHSTTNNDESFFLSETNITKQIDDSNVVTVNLDKQGFKDFKEMMSFSGFVVIGTVKEIQGTVNLARNIYNTDEPDNAHPAMAKKYLIAVEESLKGNVGQEIIVTQRYTMTDNMGNTFNLEDNEVPLEVGARYVLFLLKNPGKTKELKDTYFGIGDPWQIKLLNNEGIVECGNKDILKFFNKKSEKDLIKELKGYAL